MYITRSVQNRFEARADRRNILLLLGARQVGKTTLLKHIFASRKITFLNLDIAIDVQTLQRAMPLDPLSAIARLGSPDVLVIDEAQRMPEISRVVKGWYDTHVPVEIILSGSSSLNLLDQTVESLTGRNEKVYLAPLSFSEILAMQPWYTPEDNRAIREGSVFAEQIQSVLMQSVVYGGYPKAVSSPDPVSYLQSLVSDYVLKDVFESGLIKSPSMIRKMLELLAHQVGSIVSTNELSRTLGISRVTVDRYLDILEQTFIVFRLPAYSTNPRKEIVKSKKIYFWDTGVRNALIGEFSMNPFRSDIGALWENWVVSEVAKKTWTPLGMPLSFWRSKAGSEVDLVWKDVRNGTRRAYEIKWSSGNATKAFSTSYRIPVSIIHRNNVCSYLMDDQKLFESS